MAKMAYNVSGQGRVKNAQFSLTTVQMEMHADDDFSQSFDFASGATAERFQNPLWAVTELFTGSKFRKSIAVVKDFGRRIVASAVHDRSGQKAGVKAPNTPHDDDDGDSKLNQISGTLIQSLLDAIDNEDTVADAALTYLSAGRDTTGQALTWTFYLLLQHPSAVSEIRREVQHLLAQQQPPRPDDADPEHQTPNPTLFTPLSVPYTMAVFHETLRLYPPIPFEIRQCQADTTLPDGTFLPRHAVLVWCLWAMHRSRLTWGADADAFRPERFLEQQEQQHGGGEGDDEGGGAKPRFVLGKSVSEFPVFYGGARACLGRKMAELIAAQVIPVMVWLFEFEPAFEGERVSKTSLTLPMEGGLPVRVRRRVGDVRSN
jgi:cytochrome P450